MRPDFPHQILPQQAPAPGAQESQRDGVQCRGSGFSVLATAEHVTAGVIWFPDCPVGVRLITRGVWCKQQCCRLRGQVNTWRHGDISTDQMSTVWGELQFYIFIINAIVNYPVLWFALAFSHLISCFASLPVCFFRSCSHLSSQSFMKLPSISNCIDGVIKSSHRAY